MCRNIEMSFELMQSIIKKILAWYYNEVILVIDFEI